MVDLCIQGQPQTHLSSCPLNHWSLVGHPMAILMTHLIISLSQKEHRMISTILTAVGLWVHGHSESSESWSPYDDINDTSDNFPEPEGTQNDINNTYSCWVMSTCMDILNHQSLGHPMAILMTHLIISPEPEGTQISTILTVVSLCVDEDFSGDCKK